MADWLLTWLMYLRAYPRQNHLTYVLQPYGRLITTRFLRRYLQSQFLRQRIHVQLSKGEERPALRTWRWFGSAGVIRRKQQEYSFLNPTH